MDYTNALKLSLEYITDISQLIELRTTCATIKTEIDHILKKRYHHIFKESSPENIGMVIHKLREIYDLPICSRCHTINNNDTRKCGRTGCIGHYMTVNGVLK